MLYLIVAIISIGLFGFLVVGWVCYSKYSHTHKIAEKLDDLYADHFSLDNTLGFILWIVAWVNIIILIMMSIIVLCTATYEGATYARLEAERECLVYELENNLYDDNGDDVVGKKELYGQIRDFNTKVAYNKTMNDNLWLGVFYSNAYENIEPIPLE